MKVLITGAAGFVGRHLAAELLAHGHVPAGLVLPGERAPEGTEEVEGDVTRPETLRAALAAAAPDACVHLAGISSVPAARADPARAYAVNVLGTVHLLDAFRAARPAARLLVVSTTHVYGPAAAPGPFDEDAPLRPDTFYALTKAAADQAALQYAREFGLDAMTVRPGNHIGPGQSRDFVVSAFAAQLAEMAAGRAPPRMRTGNLESRRDFMDVRDTVRGYRLLLERGAAGRAYNMAAGRTETVGRMLELLCGIAGVRPACETDPALFRPKDASPELDTARIRAATGWAPEIPLEATLRAIYGSLTR